MYMYKEISGRVQFRSYMTRFNFFVANAHGRIMLINQDSNRYLAKPIKSMWAWIYWEVHEPK